MTVNAATFTHGKDRNRSMSSIGASVAAFGQPDFSVRNLEPCDRFDSQAENFRAFSNTESRSSHGIVDIHAAACAGQSPDRLSPSADGGLAPAMTIADAGPGASSGRHAEGLLRPANSPVN